MNVEGGRQRRREGGSIDGGAHEGGVVFFGRLDIFRQGLHPVGQDEQGDLVGQKPVDALHPLVIAQAAEIIILRLADDLDVGGVEIFKKARQGQGRPGDRPAGDEEIQIILRAIDGLQPELAHQLVELHRIIAHALSPVCDKDFVCIIPVSRPARKGYGAPGEKNPRGREKTLLFSVFCGNILLAAFSKAFWTKAEGGASNGKM